MALHNLKTTKKTLFLHKVSHFLLYSIWSEKMSILGVYAINERFNVFFTHGKHHFLLHSDCGNLRHIRKVVSYNYTD